MVESDGTFKVVSETGDDWVIKLQGDIDVRSLPLLRGALDYAIDCQPAGLIVNMAEVTSIDISGLAVLLGASYRARYIGTSLLLQAPTAATVALLAATGLDRVLSIVDAAGDAPGNDPPAGGRRRRRPFPSR